MQHVSPDPWSIFTVQYPIKAVTYAACRRIVLHSTGLSESARNLPVLYSGR